MGFDKIWRKWLFSVITLYVMAHHACFSANAPNSKIPDMDDPKEFLYRELSSDAYFNLPCHEENDTAPTRRQNAQYIMKPEEWQWEASNAEPALWPPYNVVDRDRYKTPWYHGPRPTLDNDSYTLKHLCYAVSYISRRGMKGIHRYYRLRDTYAEHMPFEIGYLTQQIMLKYQNVLELFELSTRMEGPQNKISIPHLFFFYKNILEDCRNIIHLCNMIHEVTRKYKFVQKSGFQWVDVRYDPSHKFQEETGNRAKLERGVEGLEHEKFHHEDPRIVEGMKNIESAAKQVKARLHEIQKPHREHFIDHGNFAMTSEKVTRRTRLWRPKDTLDYGWSAEKNI